MNDIYLVVYYETYVGHSFDENTKYFTDKNTANQYCDALNKEYAKLHNCEVKDLGDFYVVEKIEKG